MSMKPLLLLISVFAIFQSKLKAQEAFFTDSVRLVEDKFWGIQTNGLDWAYYQEYGIADMMSFRAEAGLTSTLSIAGGTNRQTEAAFLSSLYIAAEPRWYYSLKKRSRQGKDISYNSGVYVGLRAFYSPKWLAISNLASNEIDNNHSVILAPTYGLRGNLGKYFDFEVGIGLGYVVWFDGADNFFDHNFMFLPHLRIGFKK